MKRIALLVGANPKKSSGGPIVRLHEGDWMFDLVGVVDSCLQIRYSNILSPHFLDHDGLRLRGPVEVQVSFAHRGSESHVSAYARMVA